MDFPDRIGPLIQQLEAGRPLTPQDVSRTAALQALDLAKIGQDFAREAIARNRASLDALRQNHERHAAEIGAAP